MTTIANVSTITLTGKSSRQYTFRIYRRVQKFTAVGAVYAMARRNEDGRYSIIYIGQTGDLSVRPLNHHRTACFDRNGADHLFIHAQSDEKTRFAIETDLIQAYNPPCNRQ